MIVGKMIETQGQVLSYHFAHNHFAEAFSSSLREKRKSSKKRRFQTFVAQGTQRGKESQR